jgi:hypothetical protein
MAKEKETSSNQEGKKKDMGALLIPGGIMLGFGIGFLTGNLPAWMFLGLGSGFVGWVIVSLIGKGK